MTAKDVSYNLQIMRGMRGMTINELAVRAGVSPNTLARHEHGYDMTVSQLWGYAQALGCTVDDILYGPMPSHGNLSDEEDAQLDARLDAEIEKVARRFGRVVQFATKAEAYEMLALGAEGGAG